MMFHRVFQRCNGGGDRSRPFRARRVVRAVAIGFLLASSAASGEPVAFSHARGFYDAPFQLVLTTNLAAGTIRYTVDGSAPTRTHGIVYEEPVSIAGTSVVRAFAYNQAEQAEKVETNTFLFLEQVAAKPGTAPNRRQVPAAIISTRKISSSRQRSNHAPSTTSAPGAAMSR